MAKHTDKDPDIIDAEFTVIPGPENPLEKKPDPIHITMPNGQKPDQRWLIEAIKEGNLKECKRLIEEAGCNVQDGVEENKKYGPLHVATNHGDLDICRYLIEKAANVNDYNGGGHCAYPLFEACEKGFTKIAEFYLDQGADIYCGKEGSPLPWTAARGHLDTCEMLVKRGIDVNKPGGLYNEPALIRGYSALYDKPQKAKQIVEFLLKNKANVNAATDYGDTVLHKAAEHCDVKMCKFFLDHDANINAVNAKGKTPLDVTETYEGTDKRVLQEYLVSRGALTGYDVQRQELMPDAPAQPKDKPRPYKAREEKPQPSGRYTARISPSEFVQEAPSRLSNTEKAKPLGPKKDIPRLS